MKNVVFLPFCFLDKAEFCKRQELPEAARFKLFVKSLAKTFNSRFARFKRIIVKAVFQLCAPLPFCLFGKAGFCKRQELPEAARLKLFVKSLAKTFNSRFARFKRIIVKAVFQLCAPLPFCFFG